MKILLSILIVVALPLTVSRATEGPAEKAVDTAAEVADKTVDTAKNVGHSVAKGTKKAANTVADGTKKAANKVADALTPDPDARKVDVTLTEHEIDMPKNLKPGRTAFVVKNAGKHKHNFEVQGNGTDEKFLTKIDPGETKVLHVDLERGTYTAYCPVNGHQKKGMDVKLSVR